LNNRTGYYDYDAFQRLIDTKDKDGNMIRQIEYHYVTASASSTFLFFTNQERIRVYPSPCLPGYTASAGIAYFVPAGKYFSTKSVDDANALADMELNNFGPTGGDVPSLSCQLIAP
jgi:hypothetical protein